ISNAQLGTRRDETKRVIRGGKGARAAKRGGKGGRAANGILLILVVGEVTQVKEPDPRLKWTGCTRASGGPLRGDRPNPAKWLRCRRTDVRIMPLDSLTRATRGGCQRRLPSIRLSQGGELHRAYILRYFDKYARFRRPRSGRVLPPGSRACR